MTHVREHDDLPRHWPFIERVHFMAAAYGQRRFIYTSLLLSRNMFLAEYLLRVQMAHVTVKLCVNAALEREGGRGSNAIFTCI